MRYCTLLFGVAREAPSPSGEPGAVQYTSPSVEASFT